MLTVQVRRGAEGDEKLGAIGIGTGVCHRQNTRLVVFESKSARLICKLISRSTRSCSRGVPTLGHEITNDAVESCSVVIAFACQKHEVVDRLGSLGCK